jgi:hypothetical protein
VAKPVQRAPKLRRQLRDANRISAQADRSYRKAEARLTEQEDLEARERERGVR